MKATVVLADDEAASRLLLRTLLETSGAFEVIGEASDGVEAVRLAEELQPDLVVLDVVMPEKSGLEALTDMRQVAANSLVAILSSFDAKELADASQGLPADLYLDKTIPPPELVAALGDLVGASASTTPDEHAATDWARAALLETQAVFHALFVEAATGLAIVSVDGRLVEVNRTLCRTLGRQPSDLLGQNVLAVIHPEDRAALDLSFLVPESDAASRGPLELRALRPEGTAVWMQVQTSVIWQADGRALFGVLQVLDVTDRHEAEQKLAASEARYRSLADALPGCTVLLLDDQAQVRLAAGESLAATGWSKEALEGRVLSEVLQPDRWAAFEGAYRAALEGRRQSFPVTSASGRALWAHTVPVAASLNGSRSVMVITTDVTEARRAERALRESEGRFQAGFDHALVGMVLFDPDGRLTRANPAFCGLVGRSAGELAGTALGELLPEAGSGEAPDPLVMVATGDRDDARAERRLTRADGTVVEVLVSAVVIRSETGEPVELYVQVAGLTEARLPPA